MLLASGLGPQWRQQGRGRGRKGWKGAASSLSTVLLRTGPRRQPPHQAEVEAAEKNISRIRHKVYFPNDTSEVSPLPWCSRQSPHLSSCSLGQGHTQCAVSTLPAPFQPRSTVPWDQRQRLRTEGRLPVAVPKAARPRTQERRPKGRAARLSPGFGGPRDSGPFGDNGEQVPGLDVPPDR